MSRPGFVTLAIVLALSSVFSEISVPPKVTLPNGGVLVGSYLSTVNGRTVQGFRGIPYAEPPVGDLRFEPPVPAQIWSGEKLVTKDADICSQQDPYLRIFTTFGNEDCLYINVYTPQNRTSHETLSVMVFIHGGGWVSGGGNSQLYGPDRILDIDIILVTFNYRLGALGFLSTGSADCPGNNGLKDQVLALKWVQENIEAFGGNPNDVTIFGNSAGGASVTYHMISPLSKGLFHKAIIQSGTNFDLWALDERSTAISRAIKLGNFLNCSATDENWKEMIECLRTKSADDIVSTMHAFFEFDNEPSMEFIPTIEPEFKGAFLTRQPKDITNSYGISIPVVIGVTADEGVLKSGPLLHLRNEEFKSGFHDELPVFLYYASKPEDIRKKIASKIEEFYFHGKRNWTKDNHQNLTNLFTDGLMYAGMDSYLENRFNAANSLNVGQTFVYLFDHKGPISISVALHAGPEYYGVCHSDELLYLFPFRVPANTGEGNDAKMKWAMPYMWTNFARTGNPTPPGSSVTEWKPADKFPLEYAHLGSKKSEDWSILKNEIGFEEERVKFWRELKAEYFL